MLWDENSLARVSSEVWRLAPEGLLPEWIDRWHLNDRELTAAARELAYTDMTTLSLSDLRKIYDSIFELNQKIWRTAIFIDTFDPGFDQERMGEVARKYHFTDEEVQTLVAPTRPAYITEWSRSFHDYQSGETTFEDLKEKFFWYGADYYSFAEFTHDFVKRQSNPAEEDFVSPAIKQAKILAAHELKKNPLLLFQQLTQWRDERKRLNYTGLYGLVKIVLEVMRRHNLDPQYVTGLIEPQVPDLFLGKISNEILKEQFEKGFLVHANEKGEITFLFGSDADESWKTADAAYVQSLVKEIRGIVASKGKAAGRVCIVPHIANQNAMQMQEGDILVTSMTRPEFVPLMRKAGAIITNEGGITSHAAIVSRELGKPCIIGTKNATRILQHGDMVEVDAEKGIVRKI